MFNSAVETEELLERSTDILVEHELVLYNDEVNTFDFVIESLVKVCKHELHQAEQCTYIVHYKGRCSVKKGTFDYLRPMYSALLTRGLTAEIN